MSKIKFGFVAGFLILLIILASQVFSQPQTPLFGGTATIPAYLPIVFNPPPTPTPTFTATPTRTPTATATVSAPTNTPTRTPTSPPPANVQIDFIMYDPPGNDVDGEFVRIENVGGTAANLMNWTLRDESAHVYTFPNFTLPAGGQVQVWTGGGVNNATNLFWNSSQAIWNNAGDTAFLRNAGGTLVSQCSYAGGGQSANCP